MKSEYISYKFITSTRQGYIAIYPRGISGRGYISMYFLGPGHKPRFKANSKLPHPQMEPRNEFNVHLFGHRICICWEF